MRNRDLLTFVLTIAALAGCGGDDKKKDDGSQSTDAAVCRRICERSAKAECENDPTDCTTQCGALISQTPDGCKSELDAFTKCAEKATFTCDDDDESEAKSCDRQLSAWSRCVGADDEPSDDDDEDGTTGSIDAGVPKPDAGPVGPMTPSDPDEAICEESAGDSTCTACLKSECCDMLAGCDGECMEMLACTGACSDTMCAEKCLVGSDPQVLQQFLLVATCVSEQCDAACTSGTNPNTPPAVVLPDDCLPAGSVPAGQCDTPEAPNAYDCKKPPFADCVASPTGVADIWCCAE